MSTFLPWLPDLLLFEDHNGDWDAYLAVVYERFRQDLVVMPIRSFQGKRFGIRRHLIEGKEATFWHLISEGAVEDERIPDLRRCERIAWPRPIILAMPGTDVLCWRNSHRGQPRIVIAIDDFSYLVILADRADYVLLLTAFCVEQPHRRRKLAGEYEQAKKDGVALC